MVMCSFGLEPLSPGPSHGSSRGEPAPCSFPALSLGGASAPSDGCNVEFGFEYAFIVFTVFLRVHVRREFPGGAAAVHLDLLVERTAERDTGQHHHANDQRLVVIGNCWLRHGPEADQHIHADAATGNEGSDFTREGERERRDGGEVENEETGVEAPL